MHRKGKGSLRTYLAEREGVPFHLARKRGKIGKETEVRQVPRVVRAGERKRKWREREIERHREREREGNTRKKKGEKEKRIGGTKTDRNPDFLTARGKKKSG